MKRFTLGFLLLALCGAASAHTDPATAGGFGSGFVHPFGGGDHLLAMLAVGMWGAFLRAPLVWMLPVAFPLMMVLGAVAALFNVPVPAVEHGVAASVVVLGAVVALAWRAPAPVAVLVVAAFGFLHGYAHGTELPESASPAAYATGFVLASGVLHAAGIGLGSLRFTQVGDKVLRSAGALMAVAGVWMLVALGSAS